MANSYLSILLLFNALDRFIWNTANADVTMSANSMTFASFFWYFLVSTVVMPPTLAPAREMVPKGILTGRPMNVLNVATLNIPEATLRLQAFSHISQSKVLEYFSSFFLYLSSSLSNSCHFPWTIEKVVIRNTEITDNIEIVKAFNEHFASVREKLAAQIENISINPVDAIDKADTKFKFKSIEVCQMKPG